MYVALGFAGMFLWGRMLVLIGILTKEEAKGYHFSNPWKLDDDI